MCRFVQEKVTIYLLHVLEYLTIEMFSLSQLDLLQGKKKRKQKEKSSELEPFATSKHLFSCNHFLVSAWSEAVWAIVKEIQLSL